MSTSSTAEVIVGRYALYRRIASGGMATVYLGRLLGPVGFSRMVAIKRLLPQFARDPEFVTMFLDEARLASGLRHPNIVPTLDVVATKGEAFIVMEYVQGESLWQLLRGTAQQTEPIPVRIAASIVSGVLLGLHAAHEARDPRGMPLNLVHRDVSPHNILVGTDGMARLVDFGVAKAEGRAQHLTREGHIKGKLGYMAPEQLAGAPVTRASDIYSAAVVLWETLVGRKVFSGGTHEAIAYVRSQQHCVAAPSKYRADVTSELDAIVLKGMAADPGERFATAREMAAAIEEAVGAVSLLEVAEWVEIVAGQRIHLRAQELRMFERSSDRIQAAAELNTTETAAAPGAAADEPKPAPSRPTPGASEGPVPIELMDRTSPSTPAARAFAGRERRGRVLGGVSAIAALGVLSVFSAFSIGAKTRATPERAAATQTSKPQTSALAPTPIAAAAQDPVATAESTYDVPVALLPIASASANSKPAATAHRPAPPPRPHPSSKPAARPLAAFDAIGGRE